MGSFITVFSFVGYKNEVQALVSQLSRAGSTFFFTHLDNSASNVDWRLTFPMKKHKAVLKTSSWKHIDFSATREVYVNGSMDALRLFETLDANSSYLPIFHFSSLTFENSHHS